MNMNLGVKSKHIRNFQAVGDPPEFDESIYNTMILDMERNADRLAPSEIWELDSLFSEDEDAREQPSFDDLMAQWVGQKGESEIGSRPEDYFSSYAEFFEEHDHLGLFDANLPDDPDDADDPWTVADLGTMMDVNLITKYLSSPEDANEVSLLEVGGGYGRLAEAFLNLFGGQMNYVLVDAVPASIYYQYEFLRTNLPEMTVGWYYDEDDSLAACDCYVVPAWHFEDVNDSRTYDATVNISSMQEMSRAQIEYYIDLFDRLTRDSGMIYLQNTRDYEHKGEFPYPENWKLIFKHNTPRSYWPYMPVEIFYRLDGDYTIQNLIVDGRYLDEVTSAYRERMNELEETNANFREEIDRLSEKVEQLQQ